MSKMVRVRCPKTMVRWPGRCDREKWRNMGLQMVWAYKQRGFSMTVEQWSGRKLVTPKRYNFYKVNVEQNMFPLQEVLQGKWYGWQQICPFTEHSSQSLSRKGSTAILWPVR